MSEVTFHLPKAGYEILARILRGYFYAGANAEPVSVSAVAAQTGMQRPNISANNKFFLSTAILEKAGRLYRLTGDGARLAKALDYHTAYVGEGNAPDDVQSAWETIVDKNDFLSSVTTAVRVRGSMESEAFARHIALTSGVPNKPHFLTGARAVIVILKAAGKLVEREDGVLRLRDRPSDWSVEPEAPTEVLRQDSANLAPRSDQAAALEPRVSLTVMVQITPTTTDDELVELAQKFKRLAYWISITEELQEVNAAVS